MPAMAGQDNLIIKPPTLELIISGALILIPPSAGYEDKSRNIR